MRGTLRWLVVLGLWCPLAHAAGAVNEHDQTQLEREDLGTATLFAPTSPTAQHLMHELLCQCPGCQPKRITIEDCACGYAARQREQVLAILAGHDLSTARGRTAAEQAVRDDQVDRYGRGVLAQPSSAMVWVFPLVATMGGLGVLILGGRRWRRSMSQVETASGLVDDSLEDRLDDELAAVD